MRAIAISVLVLIVLFAGSIASADFLSTSSNDINTKLNNLESNVKDGKWNDTNNGLTSVDDKWKQIRGKWAMMLDHQEIDNIEIGLSKMNQYVKTRSIPDALAEISSLKLLFQHIPEKEEFNLKNIF